MSSNPYHVEDPLLRSLADMARAEEQVDADLAQLEALCSSELAEADQHALEHRAAREPELALALAAYRPLPVTSQQRISDRILQQMPAATPVTTRTGSVEANVTDLAARRRRRTLGLAWLGLPLAAAAAALLWLTLPPSEPTALPRYALSSSGGQRQLRSAQPAKAVVLRPDTTLTLTLRPATSVQGAVAARAFLVKADALQPVAFALKISPSGAMQLHGSARTLFGRVRGKYELRVLVARKDILERATELASGTEDSGAGWQRLSVKLTLLGPQQVSSDG